MTKYYSASFDGGRGGFCDDIHFGPRLIDVVDEEEKQIRLERAQAKDEEEFEQALSADRGEDEPMPVRETYRRRERVVLDNPPLRKVNNPECRLPVDAVEVSAEDHARLMEAQAEGNAIVAGPNGLPIVEARPVDVDQLLATVRAKRDRALRESDWTQAGDSPLSAAKKKLWAEHRKALRDLPKTVEDLLKKAESTAEIDLIAVIPQAPE